MKNKNILIIAIIGISLIFGFVIVGKNFKNKIVSETDILGWENYENKEYGFSIKYPCDQECAKIKEQPRKNAYLKESIGLQTTDKKINIHIGFFTKESVDDWNNYINELIQDPNYETGEAFPFNFSIENMVELTQLQKINESELMTIDTKTKTEYKYTGKTQILDINGRKVILLGSDNKFINRTYFIPLNNDTWAEIKISENRLYNPSEVNSKHKNLIEVIDRTLETISF